MNCKTVKVLKNDILTPILSAIDPKIGDVKRRRIDEPTKIRLNHMSGSLLSTTSHNEK